MFRTSIHLAAIAVLGFASVAGAQGTETAPTATLWRFLGIPQGVQKVRDVSLNRRGNFPGLERKPPIKRIADPANLESPDPAIKAAAEIKAAEDMKSQKVKAIKYLASMGCGCYDKDGKITDALLAATDDCTPDVRMAAIEAFEDAANGEQCRKCGSTSCCSEKVTKRLSEIAYERDDTGCPIEPDAEIREAAARVLRICCPGGAPMGPFEEETEEVPPEVIPGETPDEDSGIRGEVPESVEPLPSGEPDREDDAINGEAAIGNPGSVELTPFELSRSGPTDVRIGDVTVIGGMKVQPVSLQPVGFEDASDEPTTAGRASAGKPVQKRTANERPAPVRVQFGTRSTGSARTTPAAKAPAARAAEVVSVNHRNGQVQLRAIGGGTIEPGASVVVYHEYLTGERLVGHLVVRTSGSGYATATVTDRSTLREIHAGDRAMCH